MIIDAVGRPVTVVAVWVPDISPSCKVCKVCLSCESTGGVVPKAYPVLLVPAQVWHS